MCCENSPVGRVLFNSAGVVRQKEMCYTVFESKAELIILIC